MATIQDVANEANVSTATVSRVLNGSYSVTVEKKERVMAAIERVGYQIPNRIKLNQQGQDAPQAQKKGLILVICSSYIHPILHAFQRAAADMNYQVVSAHYENADEFAHLANLISTISPVLAGIALINCADNSRKFQELLEPYPVVQIGEPIMENVPNFVVYNDEIKMAEDAAEYLIHLGCRKIGMLTMEPTASTSLFFKKKRLNGYYLALMNHDFPVDQTLVEFVDVSIEGGYEGAKKLLSRHADLDAIIGATDVIAQGAVYAIRRAGKTTQDVKVFSLDNNEVWDFVHGSFPYIDPHHDEMGDTAAHVLHAGISKELERDYRVVIRHTLHSTRETCV